MGWSPVGLGAAERGALVSVEVAFGSRLMPSDAQAAREAILSLLAQRAPGATLCPSEVARLLRPARNELDEGWRAMMPSVHAAVDALLRAEDVTIGWKGVPLGERNGPYPIARSRTRAHPSEA